MAAKRKAGKKKAKKPAKKIVRAKAQKPRPKAVPLDQKTHDLLHEALTTAGLGTHRIESLKLVPRGGDALTAAGGCQVVQDPVTGAITIQC